MERLRENVSFKESFLKLQYIRLIYYYSAEAQEKQAKALGYANNDSHSSQVDDNHSHGHRYFGIESL